MTACRRTNFLSLLMLIFGGLLSSTSCYAQFDSVNQGVIKVRRAPVPSDYQVKLDYQYRSDKHGLFTHFFQRTDSAAMQFSPAEPVSREINLNDTNNELLDSSFMITFYSKQGNAGDGFDWVEWLNQYEHAFAWDDSSGIDSTTFVYSVNSRGHVRYTPGADDKRDSSATALQKGLAPYMRKLWVWYPATTLTDDHRHEKKVNCTVTVTVYAIKKGEGQRMPLKIAD